MTKDFSASLFPFQKGQCSRDFLLGCLWLGFIFLLYLIYIFDGTGFLTLQPCAC
jgi:hypothetical protein